MEKLFSCAHRRARLRIGNSCRNPAGDILCAKCVTAYDHVSPSRAAQADVQMRPPPPTAVIPSGKHSVPWSSLWQRVILASSTSGPGWSSTCLHHCRGLRMPSSCSSALGLTYNLARHKTKSAVQSGCLTQAEAVTSSGKTMKRIYVFCKLALCDVTKPTDPARCSFHPLGSPSTKQDLCTNKPIRASVLARS